MSEETETDELRDRQVVEAHGDGTQIEHRSAEDVFALLGNETRIEIMYALAEARHEPVSFSTLRDRVGTVDSGQFNYHLRKLADHFVSKTDDGYRLTLAGTQIIGALRAGRYTAAVSMEPIDLTSACPTCGGTVRVTYQDEHVHMDCVDCADWGNQFPFPPGTIEQFDRDDLPGAFDRYLKTQLDGTLAGFCPNCAGRIDRTLEVDETRRHGVAASVTCDRCGEVARFTPHAIVIDHPAVVSFYYDHGIDTTETPSWELERLSEVGVDLLDPDPVTVRVTIEIEDERLAVTVDEDASIESIERRSK